MLKLLLPVESSRKIVDVCHRIFLPLRRSRSNWEISSPSLVRGIVIAWLTGSLGQFGSKQNNNTYNIYNLTYIVV